jgi:hypothetical protein
MKLHDYRQLRAFLAAITPLGLLTSACADLGDFDEEVCIYQPDALANLQPADGVDYLVMRSLGGGDLPTASTMSEWGSACDSATDGTACQDALAATPADPQSSLWGSGGFGFTWYDLVYTRGDETGRITDSPTLLEVLGNIDTPNEAILVAYAEGHSIACGEANWRRREGGYELRATRGESCGGEGRWEYELLVGVDGTLTKGDEVKVENGDPHCAIGRRPDGLCSRTRMAQQLGEFFANAAHLEAASVPAFAQLARELAAHGAPRRLVRAATRACGEEIRHARATAALARRFGAAPIRPIVRPRPLRSLFEMALDNGTEGCVRETFGAATATVQARMARDARVRRAMRGIADDETRHAELSWAIDAWAHNKLNAHERRAIQQERRGAVAELRHESSHDWSPAIQQGAGMPGIDAAMRMLEPMDVVMWRA